MSRILTSAGILPTAGALALALSTPPPPAEQQRMACPLSRLAAEGGHGRTHPAARPRGRRSPARAPGTRPPGTRRRGTRLHRGDPPGGRAARPLVREAAVDGPLPGARHRPAAHPMTDHSSIHTEAGGTPMTTASVNITDRRPGRATTDRLEGAPGSRRAVVHHLGGHRRAASLLPDSVGEKGPVRLLCATAWFVGGVGRVRPGVRYSRG